jgi:hypothetical protein
MRILGVTASGIVGFDPAYELISTTLISSNTPSVTFSNLGDYSSTYKHLQIRYTARVSRATALGTVIVRFNGDSATNYSSHDLYGNGTSVLSSAGTTIGYSWAGITTGSSSTSNVFSGVVLDLLDPFSTTKNKTLRSLAGQTSNNFIVLGSGNWRSTSSVTSIVLSEFGGGDFVAGSRFSLYGIKG